jgi:glutamate dehydrogenase
MSDAARSIEPVSPESGLARGEDERATAILAEAANLLRAGDPGLKAFFEGFYRSAAPEDLRRYAPESLAALASLVFTHTALRKPGETFVTAFDFHARGPASSRNETALLAVNDDMPFLFDSVLGEMNAQGVRVHALFHPIMTTKRDAGGKRDSQGAIGRESVIVLILDPSMDEGERARLIESARAVFQQVRLAVRDWRKMIDQMQDAIAGLKEHPPAISRDEYNESVALLEWIGDNHFTFLGCRDYAFVERDGGRLEPIDATGLGVLSDVGARVISKGGGTGLAPDPRAFPAAGRRIFLCCASRSPMS